MTPPDIGRALRQRRTELRLTLEQLGHAAHVHPRRVQRAETGEHSISAADLAAVLRVLDWTDAELAQAAAAPAPTPPPIRLRLPPEHAARVPPWALQADWGQSNGEIADAAGVCRQRVHAVRRQLARLGYPVALPDPAPAPPPIEPPPPRPPIHARTPPEGVRVPAWALRADWGQSNGEIGRAVPAAESGPLTRDAVRIVRLRLVAAGCL
jgi:transcriptional regulator with XRE-family HTH domain